MNKSIRWVAFVLLALGGHAASPSETASTQASSDAAKPVTVPLHVDDGRPLVAVRLVGADGSSRTGRFLVDTGGGAFIIPEPLARELGLRWSDTFRSEGREFARPATLPEAFLDDLRLPLKAERVLIAIGQEQGTGRSTGLFPGHILAKHHVIFDYPGRTLTLATPGSIEPQGEPMPMPVSRPMGFPRTEIEVSGETYGMLLDTGPPATIVSQAVLETWGEENPAWQRHDGAWGGGEALARAGGQVIETMVIEEAGWGSKMLDELTVASQREGVFERHMSRMMTAPIVGALGSNAFMPFRIELDYLNETLYISRPASKDNTL